MRCEVEKAKRREAKRAAKRKEKEGVVNVKTEVNGANNKKPGVSAALIMVSASTPSIAVSAASIGNLASSTLSSLLNAGTTTSLTTSGLQSVDGIGDKTLKGIPLAADEAMRLKTEAFVGATTGWTLG